MKVIALTLVFLLAGYLLIYLVLLGGRVVVAKNLSKQTKPFTYTAPAPVGKILMLGDSTAVGVGADEPQYTTAGYLHQTYPDYSIDNISRYGAKLAEVYTMLEKNTDHYDLVVIQAGANDIIYFNSKNQAAQDLDQLLALAKEKAKNVVFLTAGNIGSAPIFWPPLSWYYSWRSRDMLTTYEQVAAKHGITMVELYQKKSDDIFTTDPQKYYAADGLHLTGEGYRVWHESILNALKASQINLE